MSVTGWQILEEKGISVGLLELMEKVDELVRASPSFGRWEYSEAIAMVTVAYQDAYGVQ